MQITSNLGKPGMAQGFSIGISVKTLVKTAGDADFLLMKLNIFHWTSKKCRIC
jgi:hypothetical protein